VISTPENVHGQSENSESNEDGLENNVDFEFLKNLSERFKGRDFLILEMTKIYLNQAREIEQVIVDSFENEDFEKIRFEAHKFKSTVNIIGLELLKDLSGKLENAYHSGHPEFDTLGLRKDFLSQLKSDIKMVEIVVNHVAKTSKN